MHAHYSPKEFFVEGFIMQNGREADPYVQLCCNLPIYEWFLHRYATAWKKGLCHWRDLYPKKMNTRRIHSCWWSWWFCAISAPRGIVSSREDRIRTFDSFHFSNSGQAESAANRYVPSGWSDDDDGTYI